jgi:hypothetical protein
MWRGRYLREQLEARGLTPSEARATVEGLWGRVHGVIWASLAAAQPRVLEAQRAQRTPHSACMLVRYDLMLDDDLNVWMIEVNMSPNMIPHEGGEQYDTPWRVLLLREAAALLARRPELVPSAVRLNGSLSLGLVPTQTPEFVALQHACLQEQAWRWSCDVPVSSSLNHFSGTCSCRARLLRHKETGLYRCEQLGAECGGVSFKETLGYPVNSEWYDVVRSGE